MFILSQTSSESWDSKDANSILCILILFSGSLQDFVELEAYLSAHIQW